MLFQQHGAKLRGVAVAVGDAVLGAQPRPARNVPTIGTILSNLGQFASWCARNWKWIGCLLLALVIFSVMRSCGDAFGWGKSRGEIRRDAERNENTLEARNETTIAGQEEGEHFRNDARAITEELERGNEALESVPREASTLDFLRAWRDADNSLLYAGLAHS